jgi:site-specific DNA-methyltransferase (adenine-specific)/modification methylase
MVKPAKPIRVNKGVMCGDSMQLLLGLPSDFFRLILTDPPYNVSQKNNLHTMKRKGVDFGAWDKGFDQTSWLSEAVRTLMPGGSIVLWNDWKNLGKISDCLEKLGLKPKRILTWEKNNPFPRNIKRSFTSTTEHALWAVKGGAKWVFNNRQKGSYERGVWRYPVQRSDHPTKKPDALFQDIVEILSEPGDWILDPFTGSGTTNYAAEVCGRNHVGIEMNPDFACKAGARWRSAV